MISHLKGIVHTLDLHHIVLDVAGVGYDIVCSRKTLEKLKLGGSAFILTEMVIREDAHLLFGFSSKEERDMYRLLTSVQGVGAKVAMGLLSLGSVGDLINALRDGHKAYISQADGVGPKLAARLITELKDRMAKLCPFKGHDPISLEKKNLPSSFNDAQSALMALGYRALEIEQVLRQLPHEDLSTEETIRLSLKSLGKHS